MSAHAHTHTHAHTAVNRVLPWRPEGAPRIARYGWCVRDTAHGLGVGLRWGRGLVWELGLPEGLGEGNDGQGM